MEASQTPMRMFVGDPPEWALSRRKPPLQRLYDFLGAPLRMIVLPDHVSERLHLTSLRAERLGAVLPQLRGRCLDIGAGDNALIDLYRKGTRTPEAVASVGVDVHDWGAGCLIVPDCRRLPFPEASFDTVTFVACLNHIPERDAALSEAFRVLRPGGRVVVTMIGRFIGDLGHRLWWYSEDKHRVMALGEVMGLDTAEVLDLLRFAGFSDVRRSTVLYGMNKIFVASRC